MSAHAIDLDAEAIFLDGHWFTRDDLARRIKAMLDAGDFAVARPSTALEQLTQALANVRTLAFRVPAELADALTKAAQTQNKTVGALLRELAGEAVGQTQAPAPAVAAAIPAAPGSAPVLAGPGALKAAGVESTEEKPVELTNPKKKEDESAEQRWFKA